MAAGQKRDAKYVEALLSKRIEFVKKLKTDLSTKSCTTAQTIAAYSEILEEILTDIAVQTHRSIRTGTITKDSLLPAKSVACTDQKVLPQPVKGAKTLLVDVFGQVLTQQPRDEVTCVQCGRRIAASRFAPHLEKCLGKGRNASRRRASNI